LFCINKDRFAFYFVSPMTKSDPFIFTSRTVWMQRCSDMASKNHVLYLRGSCPPEKLISLWDKFNRFYDLEMTRLERSRLRKKGFASARMFLLARKDFGSGNSTGAQNIEWILMRSDGLLNAAADDARERWLSAVDNKQRIKIDGMELVRLTREGNQSPSWTWRFSRDLYEDLRNSIVDDIRHHRIDRLSETVERIWRAPGFAGVRAQGKSLMKLIRDEQIRSQKPSSLIDLPQRFGYIRRIQDKGMRLSLFLKNK